MFYSYRHPGRILRSPYTRIMREYIHHILTLYTPHTYGLEIILHLGRHISMLLTHLITSIIPTHHRGYGTITHLRTTFIILRFHALSIIQIGQSSHTRVRVSLHVIASHATNHSAQLEIMHPMSTRTRQVNINQTSRRRGITTKCYKCCLIVTRVFLSRDQDHR